MVILCDFDDTVADRNIATLLLHRFQPPPPLIPGRTNWRRLHQRFLDAEISLAEYQETAFSTMGTERDEQAAFVKQEAALRPGFTDLVRYCREQAIELAIVSHGLDFYIEALLEKSGVGDVPYYAVQTGQDGGRPTFAYNYSDPQCDWYPGNCKCSVLESYRNNGHRLIYAGDGASDTCPAGRADFVFARGVLLGFCETHAIPHRELTDFHVVLDYVKALPAEARP